MSLLIKVSIACIIIITLIMVFHFLFVFPLIIKDFIKCIFDKDDD